MAISPNVVAEAVKDWLNDQGSTFSESFTATRGYLPTLTPPQADTLKVEVVPGPVMSRAGTRTKDFMVFYPNIVFISRVNGDETGIDVTRTDELMNFVHDVWVEFRRQSIVLQADPSVLGRVIELTNNPSFDANQLKQRLFVSVLTPKIEAFV